MKPVVLLNRPTVTTEPCKRWCVARCAKGGIDLRWREAVKKDALKTPTGGTLTKARELIALFDFGQVAANANAESGIYGCKCGEKKSKGTSYTCCDWGSLRVDLQRPFKLGSTHWASFNVQYAVQVGSKLGSALKYQILA